MSFNKYLATLIDFRYFQVMILFFLFIESITIRITLEISIDHFYSIDIPRSSSDNKFFGMRRGNICAK